MLPNEGGPLQAVAFVELKPRVSLYAFHSLMQNLPAAFFLEKLIVSFIGYFLDQRYLTYLGQGSCLVSTQAGG